MSASETDAKIGKAIADLSILRDDAQEDGLLTLCPDCGCRVEIHQPECRCAVRCTACDPIPGDEMHWSPPPVPDDFDLWDLGGES